MNVCEFNNVKTATKNAKKGYNLSKKCCKEAFEQYHLNQIKLQTERKAIKFSQSIMYIRQQQFTDNSGRYVLHIFKELKAKIKRKDKRAVEQKTSHFTSNYSKTVERERKIEIRFIAYQSIITSLLLLLLLLLLSLYLYYYYYYY